MGSHKVMETQKVWIRHPCVDFFDIHTISAMFRTHPFTQGKINVFDGDHLQESKIT